MPVNVHALMQYAYHIKSGSRFAIKNYVGPHQIAPIVIARAARSPYPIAACQALERLNQVAHVALGLLK